MSRQSLYLGRSGQLVVMAELLGRGYNVAVPEVDVGDDIFVVRDRDGELSRVQVKTANATEKKKGRFEALFKVRESQLITPHRPEMNYVFAVRRNGAWGDFVVIDRATLYALHVGENVGRRLKDNIVIELVFSAQGISCSGKSLEKHRNDWSRWPVIQHG